MPPQDVEFSQLQIDVARNATDDFNLFHDARRWQEISENPFSGPIALGFQLECAIENRIAQRRSDALEREFIAQQNLAFSNYQFSFAQAVRPTEKLSLEVRNTLFHSDATPSLSNRISLSSTTGIALLGYKKETQTSIFLGDAPIDELPDLNSCADRTWLANNDWFLKRKFLNVGNAKNFLLGSGVDPADYFDELNGRFRFPETFPLALVSCALLERALKQGHDFRANPMVYTGHRFSVNRRLNQTLKSNDVVHMLVGPFTPQQGQSTKGLSSQLNCLCMGILEHQEVLFRGEIGLASLQDILRKTRA